jgi:hypothetical protein
VFLARKGIERKRTTLKLHGLSRRDDEAKGFKYGDEATVVDKVLLLEMLEAFGEAVAEGRTEKEMTLFETCQSDDEVL